MEKQVLAKPMNPKDPRSQPVPQGRDYGVVRILSKDIEGKLNVYVGLTKIKGISWTMSHAVCNLLQLPKNKKVGDLSQDELKKITEFIANPKLPVHMLNRRIDFETGESKHLLGADLELKKEFDIKRLKKIKSYRGIRHATNQPSRGQRTRSHFRSTKRKNPARKAVSTKPTTEGKK